MKAGRSAYYLILLLSAVLLTAALFVTTPAQAREAEYNYIAPGDLKTKLETGVPMTVVDIQVKEEFEKHHITGVVPTYAYPVKVPADRAQLEPVLEQVAGNSDPVVIVCPRGGGGAKRTYDYFAEKGISTDRLFILEKGQAGWPYEELLEK